MKDEAIFPGQSDVLWDWVPVETGDKSSSPFAEPPQHEVQVLDPNHPLLRTSGGGVD